MATISSNTAVDLISSLVSESRELFGHGVNRDLQSRRTHLLALLAITNVHKTELHEALFKDLKKHPNEIETTELIPLRNELAGMFITQKIGILQISLCYFYAEHAKLCAVHI